MEKRFIKQFGLRPLKKDSRDFKLSAVLKLPPLEELPDEFELEPLEIKNQLETDYCTQMAACGASELQEGIELSPEWAFAVSKMISGDPEEFGQDLRTAIKVHTKFGVIEKGQAPYSLEAGDEDSKMRYINNWPKELFDKALGHKKQSYFKLDGQYDYFDDIRAFLWMNRAKKQVPVIGVEWNWPLDMKVMETSFAPGGGHALYARGWKQINGEPHLIIQNSYGPEAGDNGKHYFSREIINQFVEKYGAFVFVDKNPEKIKKIVWPLWRQIWEWFKKAMTNYFNEFLKT